MDLSEAVDQVAALPDRDALDAFIRANGGLRRPDLVELLCDEVGRRVHADLAQAERISGHATWLAELLDDTSRARALRAAAHVAFSRGRYPEALDLYQAAIGAFEAQGQPTEVGRTQSSSLQALIYVGRYAEAEDRIESARRAFTAAHDHVRLARLDLNAANLFFRQDRFPEAHQLYQRAYEILCVHGDPRDVAVALRNRATCEISLDRLPDALATYRAAREHAERHGLHLLVLENDYNIAYLHSSRGAYTEALDHFRVARENAQALGDTYHEALCDLDQAELYLELNLVAEAVQLAARAFAAFERLGMRYEASKALVFLALAAVRTGETFRAIELFGQSREIFVAEGNRLWPAAIDLQLARVLQEEGRHFESRRLALQALAAFTSEGADSKAALANLVLANGHLALAELGSADERVQAALENLARVDAPSLLYRAKFLRGRVDEARGNPSAAIAAYREAHGLLEGLRSHILQDQLRTGFLQDKLGVYESLFWLTPDDAPGLVQKFAYMEQTKSRNLADLLAFRAQSLPAQGPLKSDLVHDVHVLRQELNWYYRKVDLAELRKGAIGTSARREIDRQTRACELELLRVLQELKAGEQEFVSLQTGTVADLDAIRSTLPADTLLVEYYIARGTILAAVVGPDRLEVRTLSPQSRVRHALRLLHLQLSKFHLGPAYVEAFRGALYAATQRHLQELHEELIAPLQDLLDATRLVVVPHAFLHYVPFHALHDGASFLCDRYVISSSPSATIHHLCCAERGEKARESLVMGLPDQFAPSILAELQAVAATLPQARLLIGEEATCDALRAYGRKSRFVHIASHGEFRRDNPMFSCVRMADGPLNLFDLYQLQLGCELITLSGCGTGLSVVQTGDEVIGLVRGLLYAGAQAALVTLWDVHDESSTLFMRAFYGRCMAGAGKAQAVQAAMIETRKEYPHPYHWAPFTLVGHGS